MREWEENFRERKREGVSCSFLKRKKTNKKVCILSFSQKRMEEAERKERQQSIEVLKWLKKKKATNGRLGVS